MARGQSPLVGYNTNVRHKGKLYHIQTEDSGVQHPHIITHLFADGGRIVASKKTGYAEHVGIENLHEIVKKLMQEQHKAMFIALRDCVYDDDAPAQPESVQSVAEPEAPETDPPELDIEALDRAAEAFLAESAAAKAKRASPKRGSGRYQQAVPIKPKTQPKRESLRADPQASIFNGQVLRGKSLDEVILSYLSDDSGEET